MTELAASGRRNDARPGTWMYRHSHSHRYSQGYRYSRRKKRQTKSPVSTTARGDPCVGGGIFANNHPTCQGTAFDGIAQQAAREAIGGLRGERRRSRGDSESQQNSR